MGKKGNCKQEKEATLTKLRLEARRYGAVRSTAVIPQLIPMRFTIIQQCDVTMKCLDFKQRVLLQVSSAFKF